MRDEVSQAQARAKSGITKLSVSSTAIVVGGMTAFIPGPQAKVVAAWLVAAGLVGVISFVLVDAAYFTSRSTTRGRLTGDVVKQDVQ